MNVDIIEPFNRLHLSGNVKISALKFLDDRLFIGFSNGDLTMMRASTQVVSTSSAPKSVRSFRSFSDIKRLFVDNEHSQLLLVEKSFKNVTGNQSAITTLDSLALYNDSSREVILVGNSETLQVFEWVGSHLNLIKSFDEARNYSTYSYTETSTLKLILIGSRKRLLIFDIVRKSRNVLDFNMVKEISLKERIGAITCYPDDETALLGLQHSFLILTLNGGFQIDKLRTEDFGTNTHGQVSSFSYFGFSNAGPEVKIVPCDSTRSLVVHDTQVAIVQSGASNFSSTESNIKLTSIPIDVAFLYPCYALFLYGKSLQVVDIESGEVIQVFYHQLNSANVYMTAENDIIMIGSGSYVFQFNILPYQKQLDQFLSIRGSGGNSKSARDPNNDLRLKGLNRALSLVASLSDSDEFFVDKSDTNLSNLKIKQLYLRDLYKEKAFVYFESYSKYHEALVDIASEWILSCKDILPLFPDFLNADLQLNKLAYSAPQRPKSAVKRITLEDIKEVKQDDLQESATGNELKAIERGAVTETSKQKAGDANADQRMKKFTKAVASLIVYLTDQRRIHLSFLNSPEPIPCIPWKGVELSVLDIYLGMSEKDVKTQLNDIAAVIDTSLFLCYFFTKPMLLGPLLRLPNNHCDAKIVNECLLKDLHTHTQELRNFMRELLDFYFGRKLHEDALEMLKSLAQEGEGNHDDEFDRFLNSPDLTISYLQKLTNENLDLVCKYSTWVIKETESKALERAELIFMNDSYECESYDNLKVADFLSEVVDIDKLVIRYFEWLIFESDILVSESRQASIGKFETRLCLLYLKELTSLSISDEELSLNETYKKLHNSLENTKEYDPWTVLREIPTDQDSYLRLTIFIYKRLGEHQKSVDILFNQLSDLDGAMLYCSEVYSQPALKKEGTRLLHKLLEDLVMHYEENQDLVARLLKVQGSKMSILEVLTVLPDSFPLHKLLLYMEEQVRNTENRLYNSRVASQLNKISASRLHHKVLVAESESYSINSGNQKCRICGDRLGYGVLCADKDKSIVHYGCYNTERA